MQDHLIPPHGGSLINLFVDNDRDEAIKEDSKSWPSWDLTPRQICDLELLMNGAFSPLDGFMIETDYIRVCSDMRLTDGTVWPIPITLDVDEKFAAEVGPGDSIALRDPEGVMLAALRVEDKWRPDRAIEAISVYGTDDPYHKGVQFLLGEYGNWCLGGKLEGLQSPIHFDFLSLRLGPEEIRREFSRLGWRRVVAFQTRNPLHRAHFEITMSAIRKCQANLLLHPVVGLTKPGDVDHYTRVRCYKSLLFQYPQHTVYLSLLPLSMRMAGPREALWHAIIRKNYGCTHFIVGRDHAGPGNDAKGKPYYDPYAAQDLVRQYEDQIGVKMEAFANFVYVEERDSYLPEDEVKEGMRVLSISGTEVRDRLSQGTRLPSWFTFPEVARELWRSYPARGRQGFTVFFTGLSGAGKSTIANAFLAKLLETGGRPITLLDGDIVRKNLSSELGFSREHRDLNIQRIGFVANEITKNGGIAVCAPIAPYESVRQEVRQLIESRGGFILVYVSTPLEICEERDRKGLYAKARAGIIKEFTGISDPYESPKDAEVVIDTTEFSPDEAAQKIILHLESEDYIGGID